MVTTVDTNNLSISNYKLLVKRLPNVTYRVQKVMTPEIRLGDPGIPNPFMRLKQPGNIEYGYLQVEFMIAENMADYLEIFNWMQQIGTPNTANFPKPNSNAFSDLELDFLDSSYNPVASAVYGDAFPVGLSGILTNTSVTDMTYASATATFAFTTYNLTSLIETA